MFGIALSFNYINPVEITYFRNGKKHSWFDRERSGWLEPERIKADTTFCKELQNWERPNKL